MCHRIGHPRMRAHDFILICVDYEILHSVLPGPLRNDAITFLAPIDAVFVDGHDPTVIVGTPASGAPLQMSVNVKGASDGERKPVDAPPAGVPPGESVT